MRISDTITSNYFKSVDIPGHERGGSMVVTIAGFTEGQYEDGKPSLEMTMHETPKRLGLNVTNRKRLMLMFGDVDTSQLIGRQVELYCEMTQNKAGDPCYGVRLRAPGQSVPAPGATPSDHPPTNLNEPPHMQATPPPAD